MRANWSHPFFARILVALALIRFLDWTGDAATFRTGPAQPVRAVLQQDRVAVFAADKLFTEYLFTSDSKYPYFFPVNGPRTGASVTARRTEPFPHHSSLFFGCDRVNGGNYWQEGLERGRIVSKGVEVVQSSGRQVVFEQTCVWERPGAKPPFRDLRRISISAPSPDLRVIDFEITLTALMEVRIDKNNHSLFSARMTPELSVKQGGKLVNAQGDEAERGTFGKRAPWMDARGEHHRQTEGLAIFSDPQNRWNPPTWFTRDYGFFSPTPMWWLEEGFIKFQAAETIPLRYRVLVHAGAPTFDQLESAFDKAAAK